MPTTETPSIIAACDGADRGRQAVALGRIIAEATGARLTIVAVYPHPGLPFPPPVGHHVDERHRADRAIRAVRDDLAPGSRTAVVPGLSPAHALCKLADEEGANMIVVGSRHTSAERRMTDADHALQVLHSTHAAVLVVPDDHPVAPGIRRIVVGFDDGAGSQDAVETAIELARATGAHLHLVAVVPHETAAWWLAGDAVEPAALDRWAGQRRAELADAAREALERAADVGTSSEVLSGGVIPCLLEASAGADLLVLGSRRWARIAHVVLGSVSEPIVRRSTCPTLVVPRRRHNAVGDDSQLTASVRS